MMNLSAPANRVLEKFNNPIEVFKKAARDNANIFLVCLIATVAIYFIWGWFWWVNIIAVYGIRSIFESLSSSSIQIEIEQAIQAEASDSSPPARFKSYTNFLFYFCLLLQFGMYSYIIYLLYVNIIA